MTFHNLGSDILLQLMNEIIGALNKDHDYRALEKMKDKATSLVLAQGSSLISFLLLKDFDILDPVRIFIETQDEAIGRLVIDYVIRNSDLTYFLERVDDLISDESNDVPEWKKKVLLEAFTKDD